MKHINVKVAIDDFFLDKSFSERSQEQYEEILSMLAEDIPTLPGSSRAIRTLLKKASTAWVKDSWWRVLSSFYSWCQREYGMANPMESVSRPKVPDVEMKALESEETALVMAAAETDWTRAIISLSLDCGVRASEFGRIHVQDISKNTILIHGKGDRHLRVPLRPETYNLIQNVIECLPEKGPRTLLFTNEKGMPISRFTIYRIVRRCMDKAGIVGPKRGPHCLRHSLGMNYVINGGDLYSLKQIMRHRKITTTEKYVNLSLNQIIKLHHKYSPMKDALCGVQGLLFDDSKQQGG